jgi:transketolase
MVEEYLPKGENMTTKELMVTACKVRRGIIDGVYHAKAGHPGGSLSSAELYTYLYFKEMRIDPANPKDPARDRFVLSKGHAAPGLYSALAYRGFFPVDELKTLRQLGSRLQGHPSMTMTPGVDMSTGSLGQGVSTAAGMAKAAKLQKQDINVYTLLGDGELAEGQAWEAFMFSAHYRLDNLCAVIDLNGLQIDGATKDVMDSSPVDEKLKAFGFEAVTIDGHSFEALEAAFKQFHETKGKPFAIIMKTTKGKGVSFMENKAEWHGKAPNAKEYETAVKELENELARLEAAL